MEFRLAFHSAHLETLSVLAMFRVKCSCSANACVHGHRAVLHGVSSYSEMAAKVHFQRGPNQSTELAVVELAMSKNPGAIL